MNDLSPEEELTQLKRELSKLKLEANLRKSLSTQLEAQKKIADQAKEEALKKMHESGCLLLPLKDAPAFRITVPSKVFDYMSMSRPILTNINGEGADILERCEANEVTPPEDISKFSEGMIKIRKKILRR